MPKDFGQWFNEQSVTPSNQDLLDKRYVDDLMEADRLRLIENRLGEMGFLVYGDGRIMARCRMCGDDFELAPQYISVEECLEQDPHDQYCGSGPGCCP